MIPTDLFAGAALPWHLAALAFGYLCGSIPFGVLLSKAFNLGDLRKVGSGNIGATNVLRTGNKKAAILTLLFDAAKGWLPVVLAYAWGGPVVAALAGLGAMIGHCFPVWLKFRGGKGVATFLGVVLAFHWPSFLVCAAVWLVVAFTLKYSSLSALVMAIAAPVALWLFRENAYVWAVAVMAALLWWRHGENIGRLIKGEESRIALGGNKSG